MCRTTRLLGYIGCDIFLADYPSAELLLQPIRMLIKFYYIFTCDIVIYKKYLFCQFKAYNKYLQGMKTTPTSSSNQPDVLSSWGVAEGACHPSLFGLRLGLGLGTCFAMSALRKYAWQTSQLYMFCFNTQVF